MKRLVRFWKIVVFDTLGVLFMIAAILTGWLPGPGGIPLFIIGLSLLAVNHEWAKRYMRNFQNYLEILQKKIFSDNPRLRDAYDIFCPPMVIGGIYLLWRHSAAWTVSLGIFLTFAGLALLLGNRQRWQRLNKYFKR